MEETTMTSPELPEISGQKNMTIEGEGSEPMVVEPQVTIEEVAAQVVQPREGDSDKVHVHEVYVATDRIITDPSSPLAVQIPAEGRGDPSLPIHALSGGTIQAKFDMADADAKKS